MPKLLVATGFSVIAFLWVSSARAQTPTTVAVVIEDDTPVQAGAAATTANRGETFEVLAVEEGRLVFDRSPYSWLPADKTLSLVQAEALFARQMAHDPNDIRAQLARGLVRFELDRFEDCLADCRTVLRREPECFEAWLYRSRSLGSLHREAECLEAADRALKLQPDHDFARRCRGLALFKLGRHEEALAELGQRLQNAPSALAFSDRATVRYELGQLEGSLEDVDAAVAQEPGNAEFRILRARSLLAMKRTDDAVSDLTSLLDREPNNADARLVRGLAYAQKREFDAALADLDLVVRDQPNSSAFSWRASIHARRGSLDEALSDADEAIVLSPENADLLALRAKIYRERGELKKALADLDRIVELSSDESNAYALRAACLEELGENKRAAADRHTARMLKSRVK